MYRFNRLISAQVRLLQRYWKTHLKVHRQPLKERAEEFLVAHREEEQVLAVVAVDRNHNN